LHALDLNHVLYSSSGFQATVAHIRRASASESTTLYILPTLRGLRSAKNDLSLILRDQLRKPHFFSIRSGQLREMFGHVNTHARVREPHVHLQRWLGSGSGSRL